MSVDEAYALFRSARQNVRNIQTSPAYQATKMILESVQEEIELHRRHIERLKLGSFTEARRRKIAGKIRRFKSLDSTAKELDRYLVDMRWDAKRQLYDARHTYLSKLAKMCVVDGAAMARKLSFMEVAELDAEPEEVWYYEEEEWPRKVHLFYGGRGTPDGRGHGHVVLDYRHGAYEVEYSRAATTHPYTTLS